MADRLSTLCAAVQRAVPQPRARSLGLRPLARRPFESCPLPSARSTWRSPSARPAETWAPSEPSTPCSSTASPGPSRGCRPVARVRGSGGAGAPHAPAARRPAPHRGVRGERAPGGLAADGRGPHRPQPSPGSGRAPARRHLVEDPGHRRRARGGHASRPLPGRLRGRPSSGAPPRRCRRGRRPSSCLSVRDGLSSQKIATLYRVSRATATRMVGRARSSSWSRPSARSGLQAGPRGSSEFQSIVARRLRRHRRERGQAVASRQLSAASRSEDTARCLLARAARSLFKKIDRGLLVSQPRRGCVQPSGTPRGGRDGSAGHGRRGWLCPICDCNT